MIPPGLLKRDMSKLLTQENALLQRAGLLYFLALLQRVQKAHVLGSSNVCNMVTFSTADGQGLVPDAASGSGLGQGQKHLMGLNNAIASALHRCLPDFQQFLNLRLKYTKTLMESTTPNAVSEGNGGNEGTTGDSGSATGGSGGSAVTMIAAEKARYLLGLVLRIVEIYVKIAPDLVAQTGEPSSRYTLS